MPLSTKVSGVWRSAKNVSVKIGGTWRDAKKVSIKIGNQWVNVWPSAAPTNMIGFFDYIPNSNRFQICNGSAGTPNLHHRFLYGWSADGGNFGSDTHSDSWCGSFYSKEYAQSDTKAKYGSDYNTNSHKHLVDAHYHGVATNIPPFVYLVPAVCKEGVIDIGMILFYRGNSYPPGWTGYGLLNGRFIRCTVSASELKNRSGSWYHVHPQANVTLAANTPYRKKGYQSDVRLARPHTHSYAHYSYGRKTYDYNNAMANEVVHVTLKAIRAISTQSEIPSGTVAFFIGNTIPPGWALCDGSGGRPNYIGAYILGTYSNYNDAKVGDNIHADVSFDGYSSKNDAYYARKNALAARYKAAVYEPHVHLVPQHTHGTHYNMPLSRKLLIAIKL